MKKPWNLPDLPVYSLATQSALGFNMNICTYVTAVSMKPKRFAVAVYHNTRTLENCLASDTVVLQLLCADQTDVVRLLGKKSALRVDKQAPLVRKQRVMSWAGFTVLREAAAWIKLRKISHQDAGDHVLFLYDVETYKVNRDEDLMRLRHLRDKKIISV
jgi:flavin reductase (DIM6/NTAB) family NADH-FMN oxidoreductase RutF